MDNWLLKKFARWFEYQVDVLWLKENLDFVPNLLQSIDGRPAKGFYWFTPQFPQV